MSHHLLQLAPAALISLIFAFLVWFVISLPELGASTPLNRTVGRVGAVVALALMVLLWLYPVGRSFWLTVSLWAVAGLALIAGLVMAGVRLRRR